MINQKIGNWLIISDEGIKKGQRYYKCICQCGTQSIKRKNDIIRYPICNNCRIEKLAKTNEMIGKRFGKWTVIQLASGIKNNKFYECRCDCGHIDIVRGDALRRKKSSECIRCRSASHKLSYSKTHGIWCSMLQRCNNSNNKGYHNYGGRGIKVCESWHTFINFFNDMGHKPDGRELDRIDNDGNYEASNCRWATRKENANNKKRKK